MDEYADGQFEMEYAGIKPPSPQELTSYPLLTLNEDTPALEVLDVSSSHRCGVAVSDTDATEHGGSSPYLKSSEKPASVALTEDSHRVALHPLGNTTVPAGIDPHRWHALDTDRLQTQTRYFTLRQEPLFDVSEATRNRYPVPVSPSTIVPPANDSDEEREHDPSEMPFLDHLEEFRWALLKSIMAVGVCMILGWFLSDLFFNTITYLADRVELDLITTKIMEAVMVKLQMSLVIGLLVALPFVFYFIWSFVAPGLYKNEKKWILPLVWGATGCFFIGAALAFFVLIPLLLSMLKTFIPPDILPLLTVGDFVTTLLKFTLFFGLVFELPMVTFVVAKIGLIKYTWMAKYRKYAIVAIFILGAIFTPPEPVSQIMMAIPLIILYEVSILVARFAGRKTLI